MISIKWRDDDAIQQVVPVQIPVQPTAPSKSRRVARGADGTEPFWSLGYHAAAYPALVQHDETETKSAASASWPWTQLNKFYYVQNMNRCRCRHFRKFT
jgi:hypothetical protein